MTRVSFILVRAGVIAALALVAERGLATPRDNRHEGHDRDACDTLRLASTGGPVPRDRDLLVGWTRQVVRSRYATELCESPPSFSLGKVTPC